MISQQKPEVDDQAILNTDRVVRFCRNDKQVAKHENGTYVLSSQAFAAHGDGCSVEIESLLAAAGVSLQQRNTDTNSFGAYAVVVGDVRQITNKDKNGNDAEHLKIAYTPIGPGQPFGPNPYHADIFPRPGGSAQNALRKKAVIVVPIDQQWAAAAYARRMQNAH